MWADQTWPVGQLPRGSWGYLFGKVNPILAESILPDSVNWQQAGFSPRWYLLHLVESFIGPFADNLFDISRPPHLLDSQICSSRTLFNLKKSQYQRLLPKSLSEWCDRHGLSSEFPNVLHYHCECKALGSGLSSLSPLDPYVVHDKRFTISLVDCVIIGVFPMFSLNSWIQ